jgi:hypothetical protein
MTHLVSARRKFLCSSPEDINLNKLLLENEEPGSSGSIVSDYGLDDRAIGVRFPAEANNFSSSLCVQTGSGAHPASCTMSTGGPFPGGKARPGRDAHHSPPSSAEVKNEEIYLLSPQAPPWRVAGLLYLLLLKNDLHSAYFMKSVGGRKKYLFSKLK